MTAVGGQAVDGLVIVQHWYSLIKFSNKKTSADLGLVPRPPSDLAFPQPHGLVRAGAVRGQGGALPADVRGLGRGREDGGGEAKADARCQVRGPQSGPEGGGGADLQVPRDPNAGKCSKVREIFGGFSYLSCSVQFIYSCKILGVAHRRGEKSLLQLVATQIPSAVGVRGGR